MAVDRFSAPLLRWYAANARALPWRLPPGSSLRPDPYAIWLLEVMAQQTTLTAVIPYWRRFLRLWPDVRALAAADDTDVMREWAGLGYYARARNLLAAARIMAADGLPDTAAGWQKLPGVGPYTAAAIAAIAFGERVAVIDTNVARVLSRLFGIDISWPESRPRLTILLTPVIPPAHSGDFAQALMDLGAFVCTPRTPDCARCPLQDICVAHAQGTPEAYPPAKIRKPRARLQGVAWWIGHQGKIALVRRPAKGLLGGMLALPGSDWTTEPADGLPFRGDWLFASRPVRHVFTHIELCLRLAAIEIRQPVADIGGTPVCWLERSAILDAGLPSLYRKAARLALQMEEDHS